jgi:hypothetical protein
VRHGIGPLAWWRTLFRAFNPAAKTMLRAGCDLWLYPAQDHWTYLGPGPAIATIHDLMFFAARPTSVTSPICR